MADIDQRIVQLLEQLVRNTTQSNGFGSYVQRMSEIAPGAGAIAGMAAPYIESARSWLAGELSATSGAWHISNFTNNSPIYENFQRANAMSQLQRGNSMATALGGISDGWYLGFNSFKQPGTFGGSNLGKLLLDGMAGELTQISAASTTQIGSSLISSVIESGETDENKQKLVDEIRTATPDIGIAQNRAIAQNTFNGFSAVDASSMFEYALKTGAVNLSQLAAIPASDPGANSIGDRITEFQRSVTSSFTSLRAAVGGSASSLMALANSLASSNTLSWSETTRRGFADDLAVAKINGVEDATIRAHIQAVGARVNGYGLTGAGTDRLGMLSATLSAKGSRSGIISDAEYGESVVEAMGQTVDTGAYQDDIAAMVLMNDEETRTKYLEARKKGASLRKAYQEATGKKIDEDALNAARNNEVAFKSVEASRGKEAMQANLASQDRELREGLNESVGSLVRGHKAFYDFSPDEQKAFTEHMLAGREKEAKAILSKYSKDPAVVGDMYLKATAAVGNFANANGVEVADVVRAYNNDIGQAEAQKKNLNKVEHQYTRGIEGVAQLLGEKGGNVSIAEMMAAASGVAYKSGKDGGIVFTEETHKANFEKNAVRYNEIAKEAEALYKKEAELTTKIKKSSGKDKEAAKKELEEVQGRLGGLFDEAANLIQYGTAEAPQGARAAQEKADPAGVSGIDDLIKAIHELITAIKKDRDK